MGTAAALAAVALAFPISAATAADARDEPSDELEDILQDVPEKYGVLQDVASAPETEQFRIPVDPAQGVTFAGTKGDVSVGLPFAEHARSAVPVDVSTLAYDNGNDSVTVPTGKKDGSVQITTVLESTAAPARYEYVIDAKGLASLEVTDAGSVIFWGADGSFIGGATAPWAVDSAGNDVPTRYEVTGTTLTQIVDHTSGDFTYPVVADPWLGADLYSAAWIQWVSQGYKVNADPTDWGVAYAGPPVWFAHVGEVKGRLGSNQSKYTDTIMQQHYCHLVGLPRSLPVFNLESWRPNMSYVSQAPYNCNYPEGNWS